MKKARDLMRVQGIIKSNKFDIDDEFIKLLKKDLISVFNDYFNYKNTPVIDIISDNEGVKVSIKLIAQNIKFFGKV